MLEALLHNEFDQKFAEFKPKSTLGEYILSLEGRRAYLIKNEGASESFSVIVGKGQVVMENKKPFLNITSGGTTHKVAVDKIWRFTSEEVPEK